MADNGAAELKGEKSSDRKSCPYRASNPAVDPETIPGLPWAVAFCSRDTHRCLYLAGTVSSLIHTGMLASTPVIGGDSPSFTARCAVTIERFPPADDPPITKPLLRSASSADWLAAIHFTASHTSFGTVGNLCSGARR